jgi:hypothetical protein
MFKDLRAFTLVTMGIVCGLIWGGACRNSDHDAHAVQGTTAGSILVGSEPFMGAASDVFVMMGNPLPEDRATMIAPRAGTITNLFVKPNQTAAAGSSVTVALRVNGVDTALTATATSANGTTAVGNTTTSIAVAQGDRIVFRFLETLGVSTGVNWVCTAEYR